MTETQGQYVQYAFWRLDSVFHNLESNERIVAKQHFLGTWESFQNKALLVSYSLTGLRSDCDILCVRVADSLELLQDMTCRLQSSGVGKFMIPTYSYLAQAEPETRYVGKASAPTEFSPGQKRYLFFSPWVSEPGKRAKNAAPLQKAAAAHNLVLHPGLRGLEEYDDLLAAEADRTEDYAAFSAEVRVSRQETHSTVGPTFVATLKDIRDQIDALG
ncbi:MAG: chlorite dismutase family protein [Elusimicrobia bacterium]|nr:chlorite dismutase family protein [Elusimicrobiota bacterium]